MIIRANQVTSMATISVNFSADEKRKLDEICVALNIEKSEALGLATKQLWTALQIGQTFEDRAGGPPAFLLHSGNSASSSREQRMQDLDSVLDIKASRRKTAPPGEHQL